MKQTIEIDVPDGYELINREFDFKNPLEGHPSGSLGTTIWVKLKQTKDFSFYVDQYLYENGSTNDQIVNWLSEDIISVAKHRLKTNQFSLVPWEVKMGLFRFICEYHKCDFISALQRRYPVFADGIVIMSKEFIDDLFKNKN